MNEPFFEHPITTRGTEIDGTATISTYTFLRYFEHIRWMLMQEPHLGLVELIHASHFFVVRTQVLEMRRRIGMGVALIVRTHFEHCGRSTARVLHEAVRADDGAVVARARVTGVWLGGDRKMARLPDAFRDFAHMQAGFADPDLINADVAGDPWLEADRGGHAGSFITPRTWAFPALSVATEPPKSVPPELLFEHTLTVAPRDLDVFGHVNAATWLSFAHDARFFADRAGVLPADTSGRHWTARIGLFYGREAVVGDRLRIGVWQPAPRALAYVFADDSGASPTPLCMARGDYSPGGAPVTEPTDNLPC